MSDELHTAAWEITWPGRRVVHAHNAVADYRHKYPDATSRELVYKDDAERQICELQARVAELERDAGRYRWLKIHDNADLLAEDVIDEAILAERGERR